MHKLRNNFVSKTISWIKFIMSKYLCLFDNYGIIRGIKIFFVYQVVPDQSVQNFNLYCIVKEKVSLKAFNLF